jgi:hypothetical protein
MEGRNLLYHANGLDHEKCSSSKTRTGHLDYFYLLSGSYHFIFTIILRSPPSLSLFLIKRFLPLSLQLVSSVSFSKCPYHS